MMVVDPADLVRRAQRVYGKLHNAEYLTRDDVIKIIGSEDVYRVVCLGLNHIGKAEGRRGPSGGLTRASHSQLGFTERHLKDLRTYFEESCGEDAVEDTSVASRPTRARALLDKDAERLRRLLESEGGSLGRREIIETLGLSEERYGAATADLVDSGAAKKNLGRSGGLSLVETESKNSPAGPVSDTRSRESDLYPPFTQYLENQAKNDADESRSVILQTFKTRKRKWEAPDLTEVRVTAFRVLGQWELRIATYELKRKDSWSIESVLQTATYSEFAHESWLVVPSGDGDADWVEYFTKRVVDKAGSFGIGLATFIEDEVAMKKHMVPRRQLPDLATLHKWLEEVVDKLREPQLMKDIANNIAWAKRKAEAGRD